MVHGPCRHGVVVGVADLRVAEAEGGPLITYALGSCLGLAAYDPVLRVGGLLHYMLPQPTGPEQRASRNPFLFGATGIPLLLRMVAELGGRPDRLILCAAGAAEVLAGVADLALGRRNRAMLGRVLAEFGLVLAAEDTGGNHARTMCLDLARGKIRSRCRDHDTNMWAPGQAVADPAAIEP